MKIYCVITTKNRVEFLEKALSSVRGQTKKPDKIIIASDSDDDNYKAERNFIENNTDNIVLLKDEYEHNYAGNLNTAIDYIIREEIRAQSIFDISKIYLAFLDDDDTWKNNYLEICKKYLYDSPDFVVAGLNYKKDNNKDGEKLEIPKKLNRESFLASNPHIQGSNTFIKLETLLRAGCFDESMNSTTDRDLFTRVMMLNPKYKIIDEILVDINAENTRPRLTNDKDGKKISLSYFYSKYGGLMNQCIKNKFLERSRNFTDLLSIEDINNNLSKYSSNYIDKKIDKVETELNYRIVFSFIMTDFNLGKRLYDNIIQLNINNYKIIIFDNTNKKNKLKINENTKIFTLDDFKKNIENVVILKNLGYKPEGIITDISTSRIILNTFIKENTNDNDIIWILDDDMEFKYKIYENNKYITKNLDVKYIINKYYKEADVLIGSYSLDPPVPLLSTIRTSLLDFTYQNFLGKNELYKTDILNYRDYYYDFAEKHFCLETPLPCDTNNIDDIFDGKAHSRYLFVNSDETFEPFSRGGNTIIYNRDVLDIPNISPRFFDKITRRSDFFWAKLAKEKNYKVIGSSFATFHNRLKNKFDFEKECDKLLKDTLGSSFNKCYQKGQKDIDINNFINDVNKRICRIIISFYRINGLLSICHDKKYIDYFSSSNIARFLNKLKEYTLPDRIKSAYKCIERNIWKFDNIKNIKKYLENNKDFILIGFGSEGFVIKKNNFYKKIYYKKLSQEIIDINLKVSKIKSNNILPINFINEDQKTVLYYEREGEFSDYKGGYIKDIINLINQLKDKNLVLTNLKSENFKINNGHLVLIDYGKNIENLTYEKYERQIKRAFQMFKFSNVTNEEFGEIKFKLQKFRYGLQFWY